MVETLAPDPRLVSSRARGFWSEDPLERWRFSSSAQRDLFKAASEGNEVLFRSGNIAGKTAGGAGFFTHLLRGESSCDGRTFNEVRSGVKEWRLRLPLVPMPARCLLAVPTYKTEGATEALDKFLGKWPHHSKVLGNSSGSVGLVYVRPNRWSSDNHRTWSRMIVFPDKGPLPKSLRLHGAWNDEVIRHACWSEARMRRIPGHGFYKVITMTPRDKAGYLWYQKDFGIYPHGPESGRVHINCRASDNQLLTQDDLLKIRQDVENDPYAAAKLNGDWVDAAGKNPFGRKGLALWAQYAETGEKGMFHADDQGGSVWIPDEGGLVEKFRDPLDGEECWMIADSSAGISPTDSGEDRDPSGMWVVSRNRKCLMARYNGYLEPHKLERLMSAAGYYYNTAEAVPEANGEYGGALVALLVSGGYPNIYTDERIDRTSGSVSRVFGWHTNSKTRALLVAALQKAINNDLIDVYSIEAIDSLRQVVLDQKDRTVAGPGYHDEDMICGGIFAYLLDVRGDGGPIEDERPMTLREALDRELGRDPQEDFAEELTLG